MENKIDWSFKEWTERKEGLAILEGFDDLGNAFTALGEISLGEIVKVEDIEPAGEHVSMAEYAVDTNGNKFNACKCPDVGRRLLAAGVTYCIICNPNKNETPTTLNNKGGIKMTAEETLSKNTGATIKGMDRMHCPITDITRAMKEYARMQIQKDRDRVKANVVEEVSHVLKNQRQRISEAINNTPITLD